MFLYKIISGLSFIWQKKAWTIYLRPRQPQVRGWRGNRFVPTTYYRRVASKNKWFTDQFEISIASVNSLTVSQTNRKSWTYSENTLTCIHSSTDLTPKFGGNRALASSKYHCRALPKWTFQCIFKWHNWKKTLSFSQNTSRMKTNSHGILLTISLAFSALFKFLCTPLPAQYLFSSCKEDEDGILVLSSRN